MKRSNWKFFVIMGILIVLASLALYSYDTIISIIGLVIGVSNIWKGSRLYRGIQPRLISKYQEQQKEIEDEENRQLKNKKHH